MIWNDDGDGDDDDDDGYDDDDDAIPRRYQSPHENSETSVASLRSRYKASP